MSRLVRAAGLLGRCPAYYRARIALNVALLAVGWTVFALLGPSWWQLLIAAFLAIMFVQVGFLGHDAGHRQVFRSGRHNDLLGLLCADLLIGLSYSWWIDKHNRHHAHPNHVDRDPDIDGGGVAFTAAQARARHSIVGRWLARHQAALFFPMLLLEGLALHIASVRALRARPAGRTRRVESMLLGAHVGGYLAAVFLVLPATQAVTFIAVQQGLFGLYLGCCFAPTHKGMPLRGPGDKLDFLRRQVLTSRNIRGGRCIDLAMGGLNYQIEHAKPHVASGAAAGPGLLHAARPALPRIHPDLLLHPGAPIPARRRGERPSARPYSRGETVIILGIILLIAGFLLKISILWTIGIILVVIGVILAILGATGHAIAGRRHFF